MSAIDFQQQIDEIAALLERLRKSDVGGVVITYTPTYQGGTIGGATTYAFQAGEYVRYDDMVVAKGQINWSAATGTGEARFSLPIAAVGGNGSGGVYISGVTFTNNTPGILVSGGNTYFTLTSPLTNAAGAVVQMEAVGSIIFTVIYFV